MVDPRAYRAGTRAALALLSRGHCYFPDCPVPTFVFIDGEPIINYQIAHVRDAKPGNRYLEAMTDDERREFKNLVLLCTPHHNAVDRVHPGKYTIEMLEAWKADREKGALAQLSGLQGLTEDRLAELIHEAVTKSGSSPHVELEWTLDEEAFEDAVADALRASDDITLRRFLERCEKEWSSVIVAGAGCNADALQILDRLTCLAAFAIRWERSGWTSRVLDTLESIYSAVLSEHGSIRTDLIEPGHRLLMSIIDRVLGLGTVVVAERSWALIPDLILRRPAHLPDTYTNWVRHTTTQASRAEGGVFSYTDQASGEAVRAAYLELTVRAVASVRCLNQDALDLAPFRARLAGFDALATLVVWFHAPGDGDDPYFPWHRAYEGSLYEPNIARVLSDHDLRAAVFPGSDEALAQVLLYLEQFSRQHLAAFGGGWPYTDATILAFVAAERQRQHREQLIESVLQRSRVIGKRVPVSWQGHAPTIVTYSDGSTNVLVGDRETFRRLAEAGLINPRVAGVGVPPTLVNDWTTNELQAWLDEN